LIKNVLDVDTVAILAGKFGTYKSFMALAWAGCLATGQDWCGHEVPEAVPVIYVAAEGASGIRRRINAWSQVHGAIPRGMFIVVPIRVALSKTDSVLKLDALIKRYGARMVVLDTLHKMAPGMEETSKDAGEALAIIDQLRHRNRATFLLVHHTGHAGKRSRGSSSIEDDVDTSWVIELGGDGEDRSAANPRTLVHRKSKEEELSAPLHVRIVPVDGTDSCYVEASSDPFEAVAGGEPRKRGPATGDTADRMRDACRTFGVKGCTAAGAQRVAGISATTSAYRAWQGLIETGEVVPVPTTIDPVTGATIPAPAKTYMCPDL
jgi:hypothetical protein